MSPKEFPFPQENVSTNSSSTPEAYYKQPIRPVPIITHLSDPTQPTVTAYSPEPSQQATPIYRPETRQQFRPQSQQTAPASRFEPRQLPRGARQQTAAAHSPVSRQEQYHLEPQQTVQARLSELELRQQAEPDYPSARRPAEQPSMRTPTKAQSSNMYEQTAPSNAERRPIDPVHATPTKSLQQRRSTSRQGTARERYRATSSETEPEDQYNHRPRSRKPATNNPRAKSYTATDIDDDRSASHPTTARPLPHRQSSGSASDSGKGGGGGKPRGLSFHEARTYMKSGRAVRSGEWDAGQPQPPTTAENIHIKIPEPKTSPPRLQVSRGGYRPPTPPMPSPASTERLNNRIGWALFLNSGMKNHLVATLGELIGTTMFLFFAFAGAVVANVNSPADQDLTTTGLTTGWNVQKLLYISFAFGFSLMVNVWIFFRISGGEFFSILLRVGGLFFWSR